jgi:hypothetical protein
MFNLSLRERMNHWREPDAASDASHALLRAFLLAENSEDLINCAKNHPAILQDKILNILESIGEQNAPVRMLFRKNVAALRAINSRQRKED